VLAGNTKGRDETVAWRGVGNTGEPDRIGSIDETASTDLSAHAQYGTAEFGGRIGDAWWGRGQEVSGALSHS